MLKALLIARREESAWCLPRILYKSGFSIDAITSTPIIHSNCYLNQSTFVPTNVSIIPTINYHINNKKYDWVIVTDDECLVEIYTSQLSIEDKLTLLPVTEKKHLKHIYSKIDLSLILAANGIQTPPFAIAYDLNSALQGANKIGYPVLVKIDASSGGFGIFECKSTEELIALDLPIFKWVIHDQQKQPLLKKTLRLPPLLKDTDFTKQNHFHFAEAARGLAAPVLIQKKIAGIELDTSAIFIKKQLIHFSYSEVKKATHRFGPSLVRAYRQLTTADTALQNELQNLGNALGADGILTIGCIDANDGSGRYYFEADMRPNAWLEYSHFVGDSLIKKIKKWFTENKTIPLNKQYSVYYPRTRIMPYFLRLTVREILLNKYHVWRFIPPGGMKMLKIKLSQ